VASSKDIFRPILWLEQTFSSTSSLAIVTSLEPKTEILISSQKH
jgi:hypothetical protein